MGRPTKYQEAHAATAQKLALLGCIDKEIADFLEITVSTLNKWKKEFPEFAEALKKGKLVADSRVAEALYRKAIGGYTVKSQKAFVDRECHEHIIEITEDALPDTTAAIFWLKNRQPNTWRDKQEIKHDDSGMAQKEIIVQIVEPQADTD